MGIRLMRDIRGTMMRDSAGHAFPSGHIPAGLSSQASCTLNMGLANLLYQSVLAGTRGTNERASKTAHANLAHGDGHVGLAAWGWSRGVAPVGLATQALARRDGRAGMALQALACGVGRAGLVARGLALACRVGHVSFGAPGWPHRVGRAGLGVHGVVRRAWAWGHGRGGEGRAGCAWSCGGGRGCRENKMSTLEILHMQDLWRVAMLRTPAEGEGRVAAPVPTAAQLPTHLLMNISTALSPAAVTAHEVGRAGMGAQVLHRGVGRTDMGARRRAPRFCTAGLGVDGWAPNGITPLQLINYNSHPSVLQAAVRVGGLRRATGATRWWQEESGDDHGNTLMAAPHGPNNPPMPASVATNAGQR
ncbi:hypothetical protein DFH07DRAFT_784420 [Mycena maculata]|uniref:Uncharacterized protein n=1 Tax=Mycena maculata TaxID=230809 RepID=A0AAD7MJF0_9AGAR|nr:hypothetical protein DFH07DRAFT_784420 [Mycena maculata]